MARKEIWEVEVKNKQAVKALNETQKEAQKVEKEIKDVGQASGEMGNQLDKVTGGAITKFGAFKKSIGAVIASMKTLRGAVISTGIGALVVAVVALIQAFSNSEEGQNKFRRLMSQIGVVVGNLADLLADLGEAIISAFENPHQAWENFTSALKNGFDFIKRQVIDRMSSAFGIVSGNVKSAILEMRIAWNNFTGG